MLLSPIVDRFVQKAPISVLARATLEHALPPESLNALFRVAAEVQYERTLLFSSVVDLMAMVVARIQPSLHAAYQAVEDTLPVSLTSLYNKVNATEPSVSAALVSFVADRLQPVIQQMPQARSSWLPGYRIRILDGNHLAATERRIFELWGCSAGPLPGQALVLMDPASMLATHLIPCEDAHAQERSLLDRVLELATARDCFLADRNFCTFGFLYGLARLSAFFVIRQHANLRIVSSGTLKHKGSTDTGEVFEQAVTLGDDEGHRLKARRIVVRLHTPTRDGETELAIVTNVPARDASAVEVAELYRKRWTVETLFFELTQMLEGELNTMGYPRAALLGFAVALVAYNVLSTVKAALKEAFGGERVNEEVSSFYLANEARAVSEGLDVATEPAEWEPFQKVGAAEMAQELVRIARHAHLPHYKRHPRGPKKAVPKRTKHTNEPHVSTARLLIRSKGRTTP